MGRRNRVLWIRREGVGPERGGSDDLGNHPLVPGARQFDRARRGSVLDLIPSTGVMSPSAWAPVRSASRPVAAIFPSRRRARRRRSRTPHLGVGRRRAPDADRCSAHADFCNRPPLWHAFQAEVGQRGCSISGHTSWVARVAVGVTRGVATLQAGWCTFRPRRSSPCGKNRASTTSPPWSVSASSSASHVPDAVRVEDLVPRCVERVGEKDAPAVPADLHHLRPARQPRSGALGCGSRRRCHRGVPMPSRGGGTDRPRRTASAHRYPSKKPRAATRC